MATLVIPGGRILVELLAAEASPMEILQPDDRLQLWNSVLTGRTGAV